MLDTICSIFLLTGLLMLPVKRINNNIMLLLLQSLSLSVIAFILSVDGLFDWHIFLVGCLTLIVKVILLPLILHRLVNRLHADQEVHSSTGPVISIMIGIFIVGLSYGYVVPVMLKDVQTGQDLLSNAISVILFGCFYVVSRRSVINQVIGIIVMENGLFLSALAITGGMPLIIELGIFFDVLIGVLVMGTIIFKISDSFKTLDIKKLNRLRG